MITDRKNRARQLDFAARLAKIERSFADTLDPVGNSSVRGKENELIAPLRKKTPTARGELGMSFCDGDFRYLPR